MPITASWLLRDFVFFPRRVAASPRRFLPRHRPRCLTLSFRDLYNFFVATCGRKRNGERKEILFGYAIHYYDIADYTC
jgi:hypothetical protein